MLSLDSSEVDGAFTKIRNKEKGYILEGFIRLFAF